MENHIDVILVCARIVLHWKMLTPLQGPLGDLMVMVTSQPFSQMDQTHHPSQNQSIHMWGIVNTATILLTPYVSKTGS
jgi:hypothetical protein